MLCLPFLTLPRPHCSSAQARKAEVNKAIAEQSASNAQQLQQALAGQPSVGPPLPRDLDALAQQLSALSAAQRYGHSLQVCTFGSYNTQMEDIAWDVRNVYSQMSLA
jgi:hypothetical protein